uniref:Uncharacterized protein n=1 Tax=Cacopsylla melanoneura TaxID=428564 RepID=A0A8D8T694_9HEMI
MTHFCYKYRELTVDLLNLCRLLSCQLLLVFDEAMATLLGQLLLVLSVALVVVAEHKEFGCKFDDEQYNYNGKEDFGDFVKTMKFDDTTKFKKFMTDLEQTRTTIRYKSFYNTLEPFIKMYEDYKDAKKRNPASTFADFFPNYKPPNPFDNAFQRFPRNTFFSVISIYHKMKTDFGNKYPAFKDSFVLATCDEQVEKAVLDQVNTGIEQLQTPPGFEHDRIVGVIQFLILKEDIRGFVIVESTHLSSSRTLAPIVMEKKFANHTLNKNEVQLFGPTVARYTWLPNTLDSYIRLDSVMYDYNNKVTRRSGNGELVTVPKEKIISTDLLFMTSKSLCSFVKHVLKTNLRKRYVHLLRDTLDEAGSTQHYIGFELKPLSDNDTLFTYLGFREVPGQPTIPSSETFRLDGFGFDGLKQMNQTYENSLKSFATIFKVEYIELLKILKQMYDMEHKDNAFMKELITYKPQGSSTFWEVSGNLFENAWKWLSGKRSD